MTTKEAKELLSEMRIEMERLENEYDLATSERKRHELVEKMQTLTMRMGEMEMIANAGSGSTSTNPN